VAHVRPSTFVLVHSPLVGPATWTPVARTLEARGHAAVVPSLLDAVTAPPPQWRACVDAVRTATGAIDGPVSLVGHSGAGLLLPAIAAAVAPPVSQLVFVDAGIPPSAGETQLAPARFLESLRARAVEGVLPRWSTWWGDETMRALVPDDAARAEIERELPSLPLSYFEAPVPTPPGWDTRPCAYVLLSEAYRDAAAEARARGWPVYEIAGAEHLHLVVDPEAVAGVLLQTTSRIGNAASASTQART
jgi:hypothetical protein